jgi:DNA ligase (NAD+)
VGIKDFFAAEGNRRIVERLRAAGVMLVADATAQEPLGDKLKGLSFVVSGVFKTFTRDGIKEAIEANGGKVGGSISRKTNFVVAGDDMGPAKKAKADELGVPVIGEDELRRMIDG